MSTVIQPEKIVTRSASEQEQLRQLKQILLQEDRSEVAELRSLLHNKEQLAGKISPIIREHLDFLKKNFETDYEAIINEMVEKKIEASQEDLLNVLYPVIGKMIRKFIINEFQKLKDGIDQQIKNTFSRQGVFAKINLYFFNSRDVGKEVLASMDQPIIEKIYLIQKDSGLLIGHAALNLDSDADIVAGMFTAIKSFVEDAFKQKSEELEMIEYGTYKIFIQSFYSYYIAAAINGSMSANYREQLSMSMFEFAENELKASFRMGVVEHSPELSKLLEDRFLTHQPVAQSLLPSGNV